MNDHLIGNLLAHERWLRPLVRSLVHGDEVDDVLQETWLAALEHGPKSGALHGWLATVARNFARMRRRATTRRQQREATASRDGAQRSTAETVEKLALQGELAKALAELDEPFREAVVLRYHDELPCGEIARVQGISVDNARQRVKRGLDRMRERLARSRGPDWRAGIATIVLLDPSQVSVPLTVKTIGVGAWIMSNAMRIAIAAMIVVAAIFTVDAFGSGDPSPLPATDAPQVAMAPSSVEVATGTETTANERLLVGESETGPTREQPNRTAHRGVVLDALGQPVRAARAVAIMADDASVDAVRERALRSDPWPLAESVAVTDDEGRFAIDTAKAIALIGVDEPFAMLRRPAVSHALERDKQMLIVVTRAGAMSGIVSSTTGEPLAGVRMQIDVPPLSSFPEPLDSTVSMPHAVQQTAADGTFSLTRLPAGHGAVTFSMPGFHSRRVDIAPGVIGGQSIVLEPMVDGRCTLTGTVLGPRGSVVANALVGLADIRTRADDRGHYRLAFDRTMLAADEPLFAASPGRRTFVLDDPGALFATSGEVRYDIDLSPEALSLGGRVVDEQGRGVAGIHVRLWNEAALLGNDTGADLALEGLVERCEEVVGRPRVHAVTDARGSFTLRGLQGKEYRLRFRDPDTWLVWTEGPFAADRTDLAVTAPLDRVLPQVEGRVVDRSGAPVADVEVEFCVCVHLAPDTDSWGGPRQIQRTGSDGRFRFERVPCADELLLTAFGDAILVAQHRAAPNELESEVVLTVDHLCRFRVETSEARAAFVSLRDADGEALDIWERIGRTRRSRSVFPITDRRTPILSASGLAIEAVLMDEDRVELVRLPVRLLPGETVLVQ